jgi:hypothetical protein
LTENVPRALVKRNASRKGPRVNGGRFGGADAPKVETYEPESLIAPDAAQVPLSGGGTKLHGWAVITTGVGSSAPTLDCEKPTNEAATTTAAAIDRALICPSPIRVTDGAMLI